MDKVKLLTVAVVGLLLLNFCMLGFLLWKGSDTRHGDVHIPQGQHGGPKYLIIDRLKFDHEQVKAYEGLIHDHRTQVDYTQDEMLKIKTGLYLSLRQGEVMSEKAKDSIITQLGRLQMRIEKIHYQHFEAIRKICRPGQHEAFNKLTEDLAGLFSRPGPPGRPRHNP